MHGQPGSGDGVHIPLAADLCDVSLHQPLHAELASARARAASLTAANAHLEVELMLARAGAALSETARVRADGRRVAAEDDRAVADGRSAVADGDRNSAEAAASQARFLAEVGRVLAQSSEYQITLDAVARLAVPVLGDYCAVDLCDDDDVLRRLAVAHVDPTLAPLVERLHAQFPDDVSAAYGSGEVLRSGRPELVADVRARVVPAADRRPGTPGAEHVALVEALGLVSSIIVPLVVDGRAVGALTFASSTSGRRFGALDLLLAEDVGRRASAAIAAANLLRDVRQANAQLEEQAVELAAQQSELEEQQQFLQEQYAELEAQQRTVQAQAVDLELANEKLQLLNEGLHGANAALAAASARAEAAQAAAERAAKHAERATAKADLATAAADAARRDADQANLAKSQFLASMSHELRTPLNAILGYRQLLEAEIQGPVTSGQREYLARLGRAQEHLLTLIDDVLQFAKLEAGQTPLALAEVRLSDVCARLEELVRPLFDARGVAYHCEPTAEPLSAPVAHADPERVLQILINLVTNAAKFTSRGGTVRLTATAAGKHVQVRVTDSGVGIAPDQLDAIFEPFEQVDRTRSSREGVGLGLAIARELARKMGGEITAASTPGVGSTFTLVLPAS